MTQLTRSQRQRRDRVETVIGLMAPALNIVLAAGERLSRLVESDDPEYYPPRATGDMPGQAGAGESRPGDSQTTD